MTTTTRTTMIPITTTAQEGPHKNSDDGWPNNDNIDVNDNGGDDNNKQINDNDANTKHEEEDEEL